MLGWLCALGGCRARLGPSGFLETVDQVGPSWAAVVVANAGVAVSSGVGDRLGSGPSRPKIRCSAHAHPPAHSHTPLPFLSPALQVMIARWLLHRLGEEFGIVSTFAPKPMKGDW